MITLKMTKVLRNTAKYKVSRNTTKYKNNNTIINLKIIKVKVLVNQKDSKEYWVKVGLTGRECDILSLCQN